LHKSQATATAIFLSLNLLIVCPLLVCSPLAADPNFLIYYFAYLVTYSQEAVLLRFRSNVALLSNKHTVSNITFLLAMPPPQVATFMMSFCYFLSKNSHSVLSQLEELKVK